MKNRMKRILSGTLAVLFVGQPILLEESITPNIMQSRITASASELTSQSYEYENFRVDCQVTNSWGTTKVISVTITNTGTEPIENWMLYFNPNGTIENESRVVKKTTAEGVTYLKNAGYNAIIAPNESVDFVYHSVNCEKLPDQFYLCQKTVEMEEGYSVDLHVGESWGTGFNGEIVISNLTDTPIEAWEITLDTNFTFPADPPESWGATITNVADCSYRLKGSYTSTIPANQSISLGFIGVPNGTPEISNISMTAIAADEQKINMLYAYDHWDTLTDTDQDTLPDLFESEIGTSPSIADTDGDNLPDGYEVLTLGSDPLNMYSFDTALTDAQYDSDKDGLNNLEEFVRGTDVYRKDTDADGLLDGEEVSVYGTNPALKDTDSDGLYDNDEIVLNLNPLMADTDGDGISDNAEKFEQNMTYTNENTDSPINGVSVLFEGTGNILTTTEIRPANTDVMAANVAGLIGEPFSFDTTSTFDEAVITFDLDTDKFNEDDFDNLGVLWYNEEYQRFELMETSYDSTTGTLSTTVPHFSVYCLVNKKTWSNAMMSFYFTADDTLTNVDEDADAMPDCYESTNTDAPENTFALANGMEFYSLKDQADSDNDTIKDGKEIVLSTLGDVNCDGDVNEEDITRLQNYLNETIQLTQLEKINADCNLDGEVTDEDITAIQNYLSNGLYDFEVEDASKLNYFTIALITNGGGDVNCDGVFDEGDIVVLQDFLLGVQIPESSKISRADLNPDGVINAFDLAIMKKWYYMQDQQGEISLAGYHFFYCNSNPMSEDTDGDFDLDNADPNPLSYQLNGYFAQKMGELWDYCNNYSKKKTTYSVEDGTKKTIPTEWYCFYYLRGLKYALVEGDNGELVMGQVYNDQKWKLMAGNDANFDEYIENLINNDSSFSELDAYFRNFDTATGGTNILFESSQNDDSNIDLYHYAATASNLVYEQGNVTTVSSTSAPSGVNKLLKISNVEYMDTTGMLNNNITANQIVNDITGWAGDFITLMIDAHHTYYPELYVDGSLQDINSDGIIDMYDAFYTLMGSDQYSFSLEDLHSDMMAQNTVIEAKTSEEFSNNLTAYFKNQNRYQEFADTLTYDTMFFYASNGYSICNYTYYGYSACLWNCNIAECSLRTASWCSNNRHHSFSMQEVHKACTAFIDYLEYNFDAAITPQKTFFEYANGYDNSYIITTPDIYGDTVISAPQNFTDVANQLTTIYYLIH